MTSEPGKKDGPKTGGAAAAHRAQPEVAIVGRPNVGKSTLFNRIVGRRKAIVHDRPGVTRDRLSETVSWEGKLFTLVDTGGLYACEEISPARQIAAQASKAVKSADAVIFLVDAASGLLPSDAEVARLLRRGGAKIYFAVNKVDHPSHRGLETDFQNLGFDPVYPISAEHGIGVDELLDAVTADFPVALEPDLSGYPRLAVIGRPNVGKSTLINRLLGEERLIADEMPGTTRDAVDTLYRTSGGAYVLIDTAGIRRRGKIYDAVEKFSVVRANEAIRRADICLLLLDAAEITAEQDAKIAGLVHEAGAGCIILVNKWDTMTSGHRGQAEDEVRRAMPFMDYAPVLFVSARTGLGLHRLLPLVDEVFASMVRTIPTPELNDFLQRSVKTYKPASYHGKPVSFGYMTQVRTRTPAFLIFVNDPKRVHLTYRRYLVNKFRERFGFSGIPVRIRFRKK